MWFQHSGLNHTETENFSQRGRVGNQIFLLYAPFKPKIVSVSSPERVKALQGPVCFCFAKLGCRHGGPSLASSAAPSSGINLCSVGSTLSALYLPGSGV